MRGTIVTRRTNRKHRGKPVNRFYIAYPVNGKKRWEPVPSSDPKRPATRDDAEALLADRVSRINRGELIKVKRITFRDFADLWMENYALLGDIKETTLANYQGYFDNHLLPAFGDRQLTAITVEDVQAFKAGLLKRGRKARVGKELIEVGLSAQMVKHQLRLLRQMLNHAVDWEYLRTNPAEKVDYPKVRREEMVPLSPEEVGLFLAEVPVEWEAFFLTAITGGLRIGELIAMKWGNLNTEKRTYFVKETWVRPLRGEPSKIREPKSDSSRATVELIPDCIPALQAHGSRQKNAGRGIGDDDLVFTSENETPLHDVNVVRRVFKPILKAAGLDESLRFHDLRHTCASLMIYTNESPKKIQRQMRHASIQMTFDTYGHLFEDDSGGMGARMQELIFGEKAVQLKTA